MLLRRRPQLVAAVASASHYSRGRGHSTRAWRCPADLLTHLPERCRDKSTWQHLIACLEEAALDGDTENVAVPLRMVLSMEGVECHPL